MSKSRTVLAFQTESGYSTDITLPILIDLVVNTFRELVHFPVKK